MPSISSRLADGSTPSDGVTAKPVVPRSLPPLHLANPGMSSILRCPLPIMPTAATPDSLRQYQTGGQIPQYRLIPAPALTASPSTAVSSTPAKSLTGTLTTTASTSDLVTIAGVTSNSSVTLTPTNAIAAAMTGVYISGKPNNGQIAVTHPATAGGTFSIIAVN